MRRSLRPRAAPRKRRLLLERQAVDVCLAAAWRTRLPRGVVGPQSLLDQPVVEGDQHRAHPSLGVGRRASVAFTQISPSPGSSSPDSDWSAGRSGTPGAARRSSISRTSRLKHESAMCSTGTGSVWPSQIQDGTRSSTASARSSIPVMRLSLCASFDFRSSALDYLPRRRRALTTGWARASSLAS